jgi:hypothetical protein
VQARAGLGEHQALVEGGVTVYVGLAKTHSQHVLEAIVDNFIQTPGDDGV